MNLRIVFSFSFIGILFIFLKKQLAEIIMEIMVKTFQEKKYTDGYRRFVEYWFLFGGIFFLIVALHEFSKIYNSTMSVD